MQPSKLEQVLSHIDAANADDPNRETAEGQEWSKEILYSKRMSSMLQRFNPDADALLKIAVHGQHIKRWQSPRSDFPLGKQGYHQWRSNLYVFHAQAVVEIMDKVGYDESDTARVSAAVSKKAIKRNPDSQLVEDIASMVFLEYYLEAFAAKHPEYDEEKWIGIITKTWRKMSAAAQQFVLDKQVTLPAELAPLVSKALG